MLTDDDKARLEYACKAARALYTNAPPELQRAGAQAALVVLEHCKAAGLPAAADVLMCALGLGCASLAMEDMPAWRALRQAATIGSNWTTGLDPHRAQHRRSRR